MKFEITSLQKKHFSEYVDNNFLSKKFNVDPSEILKRTGIEKRSKSAQWSFETVFNSDFNLDDLRTINDKKFTDIFLMATSTQKLHFPSASNIAMSSLNVTASLSFDVTSACLGFLHALVTADSLMRSNKNYEDAIICACDFGTHIVNSDNGNTSAYMMSDGATLMHVRKTVDSGFQIQDYEFKVDTKKLDYIVSDPSSTEGVLLKGALVTLSAIEDMKNLVGIILERNNLQLEDIDLIVPHQANGILLEKLRKKLGASETCFRNEISQVGNSISATIPTVLSQNFEALKKSKYTILVSFGAGTNAGCVLLKNS